MACKYKNKVWDNGWCNVACMYCTLEQESNCEHNKQTNADHIRAMSDRQLALQFAHFEYSVAKVVCAKFGVDITTIEHDFEAAAMEHLEKLQRPYVGE